MECRRGCSGCCQQDLSLSPVEMARLLAHLESLSTDTVARLMERARLAPDSEPSPCVLLEEDACIAYEARPIICRSHGLVIRERSLGEDHRDVCPLNFAEPAQLESVPVEDVVDLERLNQMLALINSLAMPEAGQDRLSIRETIRRWSTQREAD